MSPRASETAGELVLRTRAEEALHADEPRLVYADWCEEHGRPGEARRIRLMCAQARAILPDPAGIAAVEATLPLAHDEDERALAAHLAVFDWEVVYHRGLPWRLDVRTSRARSAKVWIGRLERLAARFPGIASITLQSGAGERLAVGRSVIARVRALWPRLVAIGLYGFVLDAWMVRTLADMTPTRVSLIPANEAELVSGELDGPLGDLGSVEALHIGGNLWGLGSTWDVGPVAHRLMELRELVVTRLCVADPAALEPLARLERLSVHVVSDLRRFRALSACPLRELRVVMGDDELLGTLPVWRSLRSLSVGVRDAGQANGLVTPNGLSTLERQPALTRLDLHGASGTGCFAAAARAAPSLQHLALDAPLDVDDVAAIVGLAGLRALGVVFPGPSSEIVRVVQALGTTQALGLHVRGLSAPLSEPLAGLSPRALFLTGSRSHRLTDDRIEVIAGADIEQIALDAGWGLRVAPEWLHAAFPRAKLVSFAQTAQDAARVSEERHPTLSLSVGLSRGGAVRAFHPRFEDWAPIDGRPYGRAIETSYVRDMRAAR